MTTIVESKDLTTMTLVILFGKLQEHELELTRLSQHEGNDKKKIGIALKVSSSAHEESDRDVKFFKHIFPFKNQ